MGDAQPALTVSNWWAECEFGLHDAQASSLFCVVKE